MEETPTGLLTPSTARELLDRYELAPRKADGQNFLVDPNTIAKIVRDAGVGADDVVLEVGPGLGSLTDLLVRTARRVVAVEIDSGLVEVLRVRLGDRIELVHADALDVDLGALVDGGPARLVANLPYNAATPIVFHALGTEAFTVAYVMVQREVGERWAASPGDLLYSGVSVKLQLLAEVSLGATVPRTVFLPVPNVDSVMVRLELRDDRLDRPTLDTVRNVVDAAFGQRRKTLVRTLRTVAPREAVVAALDSLGYAPTARPEELSPTDFVRLVAALDVGA